jgi:hypothetical protein
MNIKRNIEESSQTPWSSPEEGCSNILAPAPAFNEDGESPSAQDIQIVNKHHHDENEESDYQGMIKYPDSDSSHYALPIRFAAW